MTKFSLVIAELSFEARKRTKRAQVSGHELAFERLVLKDLRKILGSYPQARCCSVMIAPGETQLTRILELPNSQPSVRVRPTMPALAVTYAGRPVADFIREIELM